MPRGDGTGRLGRGQGCNSRAKSDRRRSKGFGRFFDEEDD